ncbi:hypothetical protein EV702DRAFT_1171922 [Suillus placidus]|uniref:Uncharacterized protein n=1 Tax=Suillus placidus TaxID=48579 RepID=A0A9P6ZF21_9AGAM|nr:hypothetical protein EV702DRAFT_1171922 [Suillus placidus]
MTLSTLILSLILQLALSIPLQLSYQRLSCRITFDNMEIHVQHGLNPQPLSAELHPQESPYLYPRLPLPFIPPTT